MEVLFFLLPEISCREKDHSIARDGNGHTVTSGGEQHGRKKDCWDSKRFWETGGGGTTGLLGWPTKREGVSSKCSEQNGQFERRKKKRVGDN